MRNLTLLQRGGNSPPFSRVIALCPAVNGTINNAYCSLYTPCSTSRSECFKTSNFQAQKTSIILPHRELTPRPSLILTITRGSVSSRHNPHSLPTHQQQNPSTKSKPTPFPTMLTSSRTSMIVLKDSPPNSPTRCPVKIVPPNTANLTSGCKVIINPLSLGPRSAELEHTFECRCHGGRGHAVLVDYIMKWMAYRIDKLGNSPLHAIGWARMTCMVLEIESEELERRLAYAEEVAEYFEARGESPVWTLLGL
ncbi:hypothetical protein QBC34DRAFT_206070 [Podospora aff. communis PSN243]|uniref:Uncharacterized protein n=1 Tax=Podospora aff. communis PSN243 TaxID=3040156 RepID=A0AAV9GXN4_9PEZI|nr:hypothetical protein QBC34DRAFT_206070 [Podospora aff. communis PSN243]